MQLIPPLSGRSSRFSYAANGLDSLSLAQLACDLKTTKKPLVIITANAFEAQRLVEEIPFFSPVVFRNTSCHWWEESQRQGLSGEDTEEKARNTEYCVE